MAVFGAVWSARLTFNYWRKGGYEIGSEDYRWAIIKDKIGYWPMFAFNVTFISFIQNVSLLENTFPRSEASAKHRQILLWWIATPAYVLMLASRVGSDTMQLPDIIASRVLMVLILIEFFADQQQWSMDSLL